MDRRRIDWSTASVSRGASGFDLNVELDGEVSSDWQSLFAQLAEQDALRAHSWNAVRLSERTIAMEQLQPEARDRARSYLSDIVGRTNDAIAAKLEEEERERLRAEREATEQARVAEELAAWFRSSPADLGGGRETVQPETASTEGDEVKDLRDRLAHPFGGD